MNLQDNYYKNQWERKQSVREKWSNALLWVVLGLITIFLALGIVFFAVRIAKAELAYSDLPIKEPHTTIVYHPTERRAKDGRITALPYITPTSYKMTWVETTYTPWYIRDTLGRVTYWRGTTLEEQARTIDTITHIVTLEPIVSPTVPKSVALEDNVEIWLDRAWGDFTEILDSIGWTTEEWLEYKKQEVK